MEAEERGVPLALDGSFHVACSGDGSLAEVASSQGHTLSEHRYFKMAVARLEGSALLRVISLAPPFPHRSQSDR